MRCLSAAVQSIIEYLGALFDADVHPRVLRSTRLVQRLTLVEPRAVGLLRFKGIERSFTMI